MRARKLLNINCIGLATNLQQKMAADVHGNGMTTVSGLAGSATHGPEAI
jgi:hypothetical protein